MTDKIGDLARRIGTRIVQLRRSEGLNQQQLATRAQVSKSILSMIENGQRVPSVSLIRRLVTALGLAAEQALIDASDEVLRRLWNEIYEGQTPLSVQLRSGQDLKLPVSLQDAEVVVQLTAEQAPTPIAMSPSAPSLLAEVLGSSLAPLHEQMQVLGDGQRELLRQLGDSSAQSLRNLNGIAHHLDRLGQRMDRIAAVLQCQSDELAALRKEVAALAASPAPPPSPPPVAAEPLVGKLVERLDALGGELAEHRRSVRMGLLQSQQEAHLLRAHLSQLAAAQARRR